MESVCEVQGVNQGRVAAAGGTGVLVADGVINVAGEVGNGKSLAERVGIGTRYAMREIQLLGLG